MNKPPDFTSHDVVGKLRGILHTRKIGHGGTLDPMATGVLPVFVGGATRGADFAAAQDKEYVAGFSLGFATDTQDTTGATLETSDIRADEAAVSAALTSFIGAQKQVPPMYSAIKIDGQKLCDLARRGVTVERPARDITIYEIELISFDEQMQCGTMRALVSKGTYVRTIIDDLGRALGTFGAMNSLVRTRAGAFQLTDAQTFSDVERHMAEGTMDAILRPTDSLFFDYPRVDLTADGYERAVRGAFIAPAQADGMPILQGALSRVYFDDTFFMLGRTDTLDRGGLALFVHKNFR